MDPRRIYLIVNGLTSAFYWMVFTVSSIYYVVQAGLDPFQLVLVGTVLELSIFIFEIPTGIVADIYSRRLSVIIGFFLTGIGFLVEGSFPAFLPILAAQVLWGVGFTFTSGALQAWITDEIGERDAEGIFVKGAKYAQIGAFFGVVFSTGFGLISLQVPMVISGLLFIVFSGYLILVMPESGFTPTPKDDRDNWRQMINTARQGIQMARHRPALIPIMAIGLFFGLFSEGLDRLWVAHLLEQYQFPIWEPVVWFGIIQAVGMLLSALTLGRVEKLTDLKSPVLNIKIQAVISSLIIVFLLGFSVVRYFPLAILFFLVLRVLRDSHYPLYLAWVNQRLESQVRATVLSMNSLVDAFGQIGGGPIVGVIARKVSITAGLLVSTIMLSPVLGLYSKQINQPEKLDVPS
jgi:DHA3 family tetracycline resistance protein-like MFS transporter